MLEANKNEYFVDGFLIKHFGIWPIGTDKKSLFEEQKIFIIYLMGAIPEISEWTLQVDYQKKRKEIEMLSLKDIKLSQTDIDVSVLHGTDIEEIKRERLKAEKKKKFQEIDKEFGVEESKDIDIPEIEHKPSDKPQDERQKLWDMLQAKGLTNNDGL